MTKQPGLLREPSLASLYEPYAEKLREYEFYSMRDKAKAQKLWAEAQEIAKAWRAGVEHGLTMEARTS